MSESFNVYPPEIELNIYNLVFPAQVSEPFPVHVLHFSSIVHTFNLLQHHFLATAMPSVGDMKQFLGGQYFGRPSLPQSIDLSSKTIIVTGSNTGVGFDCARLLASLGVSRLILACRTPSKAEVARTKILESLNGKASPRIELWEVDLDSYTSVISFCERVCSLDRLDGFVANAGMEPVKFELSEGIERCINTNVISTMLMSMLVLPALKATSEKYDIDTHLSIVGSMVHIFGKKSQLQNAAEKDIFATLSDEKTADIGSRYNLSKLLLHSCLESIYPLAGKIAPKVIVNVVNPGWCDTELKRDQPREYWQPIMEAIFMRSSEAGGITLVHAATAGKETHGKYLSECKVKPQGGFMADKDRLVTQDRVWTELVARIERILPGATKILG